MSGTLLAPEQLDMPRLGETQFVINCVLDQLGTPDHLARIDVKNLWDNQYRVNIYCIADPYHAVKALTMTDSFFVTLQADSISSVPEITRRYL